MAKGDTAPPPLGSMADLTKQANHSWVTSLNPDPETDKHAPNRKSREVKSGHYVRVKPKKLPEPSLVIHSREMAESLGLAPDAVKSPEFTAFFSGDVDVVPGMDSWATPYALSIMGNPQYQNCPFGNGNGYGDGRAVSIGEVVVQDQRWELQLKGGGQTPFCRGGDGRAVLRSSIREFLASELMFALGVDTTRALSLVVSAIETSNRPWYQPLTLDDPRFAKLGPEEKAQVQEYLAQPRNPDMMIEEPCAITTRVAPSFTRVGHVDLFSRRARKRGASAAQREELELMVQHAIAREYAAEVPAGTPLAEGAALMLDAAAERIAAMVAGWLRVGFCQGNFNADNCLVGGRTMDYGPFGWMDEYDPLFAKWVGSGQHFAFMNQPAAAHANFATLAEAVAPVLADPKKQAEAAVSKAAGTIRAAVLATWTAKMGFEGKGTPEIEALFDELEGLMRATRVDYTLMWRQLAEVAALAEDPSDAELMAPLAATFYTAPSAEANAKWVSWLVKWRHALAMSGAAAGAPARMRAASPKYVAREWMLVEAYNLAGKGDYSMVHELHELFKAPYDEQPEMEAKYYRRAPDAALSSAGTAFMS